MSKLVVVYSVDRNFGDSVNDLIFPFFTKAECMLGKQKPVPEDAIEILGIGSIMQLGLGTEICGSGIMSAQMGIKKPKRVRWVRGPLTRDLLLKRSIQCPPIYGDAALLLPFILTPTSIEKKYLVGFIPHYIDGSTEGARKLMEIGVHYIDIKNYESYQSFIDEINSCQYIISSSLHGIIAADAYNIPAYHVKLSDKVVGGEFKFRDYHESVKRDYFDVEIRSSLQEMISQFKSYECELDLSKILQLMPLIDPEIKEQSLERLRNGFMSYIHKQSE